MASIGKVADNRMGQVEELMRQSCIAVSSANLLAILNNTDDDPDDVLVEKIKWEIREFRQSHDPPLSERTELHPTLMRAILALM